MLRAGRLSEVDLRNLAEEIESTGRGEKRELVNRMAVLLTHLLKWEFQPGLRSNSWRLTIVEQRRRLAKHLRDNPSLRPLLPEALGDAYEFATLAAQRESGLPEEAFPAACPYKVEQALDLDFWPGGLPRLA